MAEIIFLVGALAGGGYLVHRHYQFKKKYCPNCRQITKFRGPRSVNSRRSRWKINNNRPQRGKICQCQICETRYIYKGMQEPLEKIDGENESHIFAPSYQR